MSRIVKIRRNRERFWVRDVKNVGDGKLEGKVDNELVLDHPFNLHDTIEFMESEVIQEFVCH